MPDGARIDAFVFERERETAYLGALREGDVRLGSDAIVRAFNGTIYPTRDRSIVVRILDGEGAVGWGETYGLVAPRATGALITDLYAPFLLAQDAPWEDPAASWTAMYALQRVRGYWGGYAADAMAALDIALWDLKGRREGRSLAYMLGGETGDGTLPAYVSGLPGSTRAERADMAIRWHEHGFDALKVPLSATENGDAGAEFASLRQALGGDHRIALDAHWTRDAPGAVALADEIAAHDAWFIEAPVAPEDVEAQRAVHDGASLPVALGEEWRTEWDYAPRRDACSIVQPEMGHTGVTQFMAIARAARGDGKRIMPHATIGMGLFMAASLRASLSAGAEIHEFQHTIYPRNTGLLDGADPCEAGRFTVSDAPGIGVAPNPDGLSHLTPLH